MIALLIGLVFIGLEYGLRLEIEGADATDTHSGLDLALPLWLPVHVLPQAHPEGAA
jgi:hypothetical protein